MPPVQTRFITHRFAGGWAPGYGKLISGFPTDTREVPIPYVLDAKNIFWNLDGGIRKIGGTSYIGSGMEGGAVVYGVYDYWRIGTSGSATNRKVCHVNDTIQEDQGSNSWQQLLGSLEVGKHPNYATFADLLIMATDSTTDVPQSWDQTTIQNLAGSPPNFAFSVFHKSRQWAAGNVAFPSRLYYSAADDPEDWTGAGSGYIDISPGDGDEIRGLAGEYKNDLWVFKGPYKGSIHRITGYTPSDYQRIPFLQGLACVGHSTITRFKDDLIFMTPSGSIRSLKATAAYGDYHDASLTFPIDPWINENINTAQLKKAWVVVDPSTSHIYATIPTASSTTNNMILCYDYQFGSIQQADRWSRITAWNAQCLAPFISSGLPRIMAGGTDGFVRDVNTATRIVDAATPIASYLETPHINYGSSTQEKTFVQVGMTLSPLGNDTVRFGWNRDTQFSNSTTISQGDVGDDLGDAGAPEPDDFLLDDENDPDQSASILGGTSFTEVYEELMEGGSGRWVQYTFTQDVLNEDLYMHAFSIGMIPHSYSTE